MKPRKPISHEERLRQTIKKLEAEGEDPEELEKLLHMYENDFPLTKTQMRLVNKLLNERRMKGLPSSLEDLGE